MHHARLLSVVNLSEATLPPQVAEVLLVEAQAAAELSYSPYSQFAVGAALLDAKGNVWRGCNVEIANYGLTVCAEQTALHKAVTEGERQFVAVAVWAAQTAGHGITPCGSCRQALAEFLPPTAWVLTPKADGGHQQWRLADLLPDAFKLGL
jgi:homotetrameric cytidine deaminase